MDWYPRGRALNLPKIQDKLQSNLAYWQPDPLGDLRRLLQRDCLSPA